MWFLQTDILLAMLLGCALGCLGQALGRRLGRMRQFRQGILLLDLALLAYVSPRLLVFYVAYALATYGLTRLPGRVKRGRRAVFVVSCLGCLLPFLYGRGAALLPALPAWILLAGIAYNMLKAIDALYYVYYTGEDIPFFTYLNFLLFFPVLTAGPIFRYRDFAKTLAEPEPVDAARLLGCLKRGIRGMFKKVVLLTLAQRVTALCLDAGSHWYVSLALMALSYLSLYLDMSGYADIAIAMGGVLGFRVPENFKNPLKSPSFTLFWRNWHITLSDWLREHIFVVFNGKRLNRRQGAAIGFFTMFFMCLWHGFTWAYALDGVLLGLVLAGESLLGLAALNRRKTKTWIYAGRCALVTALFALNSLLLTQGGTVALAVLRGLAKG